MSRKTKQYHMNKIRRKLLVSFVHQMQICLTQIPLSSNHSYDPRKNLKIDFSLFYRRVVFDRYSCSAKDVVMFSWFYIKQINISISFLFLFLEMQPCREGTGRRPFNQKLQNSQNRRKWCETKLNRKFRTFREEYHTRQKFLVRTFAKLIFRYSS